MADINRRVDGNVEGDFFVDDTCINCDTCRQLAITVFKDDGEYSVVFRQPENDEEVRDATRALLACPTGSIGTLGENLAKDVMKEFPLCLEDDVFYVGFNSPKSYGGNSYFIQHPDGNWMIDAPKYQGSLVKQLEALGGLRYIFLTHRDDVADADRYAQHFGAERIIHEKEKHAVPDAERILTGFDDIELAPGITVIPTPGHTEGHCALLYNNGSNRFLFTGDHMSWNRYESRLRSSKRHSWFSWEQQKASVEKLQHYTFEWILPGHGQRIRLDVDTMAEHVRNHAQHVHTL